MNKIKIIDSKTNYQLLYQNNLLSKIFTNNQIFQITKKEIIYTKLNDKNFINIKFLTSNYLPHEINYQNQPFSQIKITYRKENPTLIENIKLDKKNIYKHNQKIDVIIKKEHEMTYLYSKKTNKLYQKLTNLNESTQTYQTCETFIYHQDQLLITLTNQSPKSLFEKFPSIKEIITQKFNLKNNHSTSTTPFQLLPMNKEEYETYKTNNKLTQKFTGVVKNLTKKPNYNDKTKLNIEFHLTQLDENNQIIDMILVKIFPNNPNYDDFIKNIKENYLIKIEAKVYNPFISDIVYLDFKKLIKFNDSQNEDILIKPKEQRVEFSFQTHYSQFDGLFSPNQIISEIKQLNYPAITITDTNNIYSYSKLATLDNDPNFKINYGIKINYINNIPQYINNPNFKIDINLKDAIYVIFDLETTGLSPKNDKIIEISALKMKNNQIIDKFNALINPERSLNLKIENLTNLNSDWLKSFPTIDKILPSFLEFIQDTILVAHNAQFDINFIKMNCQKLNLPIINNLSIDTVAFSYHFLKDNQYHSLKYLVKHFNHKIENAHRAINDVEALTKIFPQILTYLENLNITKYSQLTIKIDDKFKYPQSLTLIVKNQQGLKDLYQLVSNANTDDFYKIPRFNHYNIQQKRTNLLIGGSNYQGTIFQAALNSDLLTLQETITFCDYIEVNPIHCYQHFINDFKEDGLKIIQDTIKLIIHESQKQEKLVIVTCDTKYFNLSQKKYYDILINTDQIKYKKHYLFEYETKPNNHLLSTRELINEFSFLNNSKLIEDIVINNTIKLNNMIDKIQIFPNELYSFDDNEFKETLNIPSFNQELKTIINQKITQKYGHTLHPIIQNRLDQELKSIIGINNQPPLNKDIAIIYFLSYLIVKQAKLDNEIVGSRGSVGSSLIGYLLEITEVNPLKPHYLCSTCYHCEFVKENISGFDLPTKNCPHCNNQLTANGNNIPFETFLGLDGNKIPDIDLNFASNYQKKIHQYVVNLLGKNKVFRAGTLSTIAERTAFLIVKNYYQNKNRRIRPELIKEISTHLINILKTTGQHPGGLIVVPSNKEIEDITPIQFPSNDIKAELKTTCFDYHSFETNLFKLDLLGHDAPQLLKQLINYPLSPIKNLNEINLNDSKLYEIFNKNSKITTNGIPEFGTSFVKNLLNEISEYTKKPFNFTFLTKISGLSHGTDVWTNNARDLLKSDQNIDFTDIIGCRDDIYNYLIRHNIDSKQAFTIMEQVRKGKQNLELINTLQNKIPNWYIDSLIKIKYLFPKAHATAYVYSALQVAYFKIYKPILFYSVYFSNKLDQFDYSLAISNSQKLSIKKPKTKKDEKLLTILELVFEAKQQGIEFLPIDYNNSSLNEFKIINEKQLLLPFISITGLGNEKAKEIITERNKKPFDSFDDFITRTKLSKTIVKILS
jgi:DNA polymerase-3 subunit alpha (Gram-positive type)